MRYHCEASAGPVGPLVVADEAVVDELLEVELLEVELLEVELLEVELLEFELLEVELLEVELLEVELLEVVQLVDELLTALCGGSWTGSSGSSPFVRRCIGNPRANTCWQRRAKTKVTSNTGLCIVEVEREEIFAKDKQGKNR